MSFEILKAILEKVANVKGFELCMKSVQLLSASNGKCKAQFTVAEEHLNPGGTLHGGFTSTVIDCISTYALMAHESGCPPGVSLDLHVTWPILTIYTTFDTRSNATGYLLEKDVSAIVGVLDYFFPPLKNAENLEYKRGLPINESKPSQSLLEKLNLRKYPPGQLKYMIYTKVGHEPKYLVNSKDHLLDGQGNPINYP